MAEKVTFLSNGYEIEGLFIRKNENKGAVITHPHPLYGGDMYSMVVETIAHAYNQNGYSTLKFNFRGVGNSQGRYDNGIGEQMDVLAALICIDDMGINAIDLVGYSFGAWVNAHAIRKDTVLENMVMVSPPIGFMAFKPTTTLDCLRLVITGSEDDIAPAETIQHELPTWNPDARFDIIDGADHFYGGYLKELESALLNYLSARDAQSK
ncbi:MAG: alpha/beta hydrolase [Desulfobacterales bacterium]|nr:MAG: alpha/beta hydrolase [Desulfobacterales bacterium]